jgi:hypothetical protein
MVMGHCHAAFPGGFCPGWAGPVLQICRAAHQAAAKKFNPPGLTGLNGGAPGRCVSIVQLKGGNESKKTRLPRPYGRSPYGMQALQFPIRPFAQYLFKHQKRC